MSSLRHGPRVGALGLLWPFPCSRNAHLPAPARRAPRARYGWRSGHFASGTTLRLLAHFRRRSGHRLPSSARGGPRLAGSPAPSGRLPIAIGPPCRRAGQRLPSSARGGPRPARSQAPPPGYPSSPGHRAHRCHAWPAVHPTARRRLCRETPPQLAPRRLSTTPTVRTKIRRSRARPWWST